MAVRLHVLYTKIVNILLAKLLDMLLLNIVNNWLEVVSYNNFLSFNRFYILKCLASMSVARRDMFIIFKASTISHQQGSGDLSNHVLNM